ncbi:MULTISPECIES: hypothetical protein [unclassified Roseateles]|uniref:hypothetical protein n=1 Tax=unclassified Roseateles TaxID=2626991 RepID=UPI000A73468E|nr:MULTISPECIES: hypothetical protein [unclassified Roseateles]
MSQESLPILSLPPLPVADDQHVDADLDVSLSTPSTLVVNASLELEAGEAGRRSVELALVIPRSQCRGERPLLTALLNAVQAAVARATRGGSRHAIAGLPRRVLTQIAGRPYLVTQFEAA